MTENVTRRFLLWVGGAAMVATGLTSTDAGAQQRQPQRGLSLPPAMVNIINALNNQHFAQAYILSKSAYESSQRGERGAVFSPLHVAVLLVDAANRQNMDDVKKFSVLEARGMNLYEEQFINRQIREVYKALLDRRQSSEPNMQPPVLRALLRATLDEARSEVTRRLADPANRRDSNLIQFINNGGLLVRGLTSTAPDMNPEWHPNAHSRRPEGLDLSRETAQESEVRRALRIPHFTLAVLFARNDASNGETSEIAKTVIAFDHLNRQEPERAREILQKPEIIRTPADEPFASINGYMAQRMSANNVNWGNREVALGEFLRAFQTERDRLMRFTGGNAHMAQISQSLTEILPGFASAALDLQNSLTLIGPDAARTSAIPTPPRP